MSSDALVQPTGDKQVSNSNVNKADAVEGLRRIPFIKESKSSESLTVSIVCSSCDEAELHNREVENIFFGTLIGRRSPTKILYFKDTSDSSLESMEGPKPSYLLPEKRRSLCSKVGVSKRVKLYRGIEGVDNSLDSIPDTNPQMQLKQDRSGAGSRGEQRKNTLQKKSLKPSMDVEPEESPSQKYSNSIFKVFLEPERRIIKKKLVIPENKVVSPTVRATKVVAHDRRKEVQQRQEKLRRMKETVGQKVESLPKKLMKVQIDVKEQQSKQSIVTVDCNSENTLVVNRVEMEVDEVGKCKMGHKSKPTLKSSDSVKKVSSKRSVRWEDEVMGPQRSSDEEGSSAGSEGIEMWQKKCLNNAGALANVRKKDVYRGEPHLSAHKDSEKTEYEELVERWTENSRITDADTDSEASQLLEEILKYPSKLRKKIADKISERDYKRKVKHALTRRYSSSESEVAARREKSPPTTSDEENVVERKARRTKCSDRNKVSNEISAPKLIAESVVRRRGKVDGETIFRRRTSSPAICNSVNETRVTAAEDQRQGTSCSSSITTVKSETLCPLDDESPTRQTSNSIVGFELRSKADSASVPKKNMEASMIRLIKPSSGDGRREVVEIDTKTIILLNDCLNETKDCLYRLTNAMSKSLVKEKEALMKKINTCLLNMKTKSKSVVSRRRSISKEDARGPVRRVQRHEDKSSTATSRRTRLSPMRSLGSRNNKNETVNRPVVRSRILETWRNNNKAKGGLNEGNIKSNRVQINRTAPKHDSMSERKGRSVSPKHSYSRCKKEDNTHADDLARKKEFVRKSLLNVQQKKSNEITRGTKEVVDENLENPIIPIHTPDQAEVPKNSSPRSLENTEDNVAQQNVELKKNDSHQSSKSNNSEVLVFEKSSKCFINSESELVRTSSKAQSLHEVDSKKCVSSDNRTDQSDEGNSCKKFVLVISADGVVKSSEELARPPIAPRDAGAATSTSRDRIIPRTSEVLLPVSEKPRSSCLKLRTTLMSRSRVSTSACSSRRPTPPAPERPPSRKPYFSRRSSTDDDEEYTGDSLPVVRIASQPPRSRLSPASQRTSNETQPPAGRRKPPASRMYSTLKESPFPKKESLKSAMKDLDLTPKPSLKRVTLSNPATAKSSTRFSDTPERKLPQQRAKTAKASVDDCDDHEEKSLSRTTRSLKIIRQRLKMAQERNALSSRPTTAGTFTSEGRTLSFTPTLESLPDTNKRQTALNRTSGVNSTATKNNTSETRNNKTRESNKNPGNKWNPLRPYSAVEEDTNRPIRRRSLLSRLPKYQPPWDRVDLRPPESALAERAEHERKLFGGPRQAKRSQNSIGICRPDTPSDPLKRRGSDKKGGGMTKQSTLSGQQDVSDRQRAIKSKLLRLSVSPK